MNMERSPFQLLSEKTGDKNAHNLFSEMFVCVCGSVHMLDYA